MAHPLAVMVDTLRVQRAEGATFDSAWQTAINSALAVAPVHDAQMWMAALTETRYGWARAFEREPATTAELALAALSDPDREVTDTDRWCQLCDQPIPPSRHRRAVYCSDWCRRTASNRKTLAGRAVMVGG